MERITISKDIIRLWLWDNPIKFHCWCDLLFMADNNKVCTSTHKLAKRWGMAQKTVYRFLKDLQTTKLLTIEVGKSDTILTLANDSANVLLNNIVNQRVTEVHDSANDSNLQNSTRGSANDSANVLLNNIVNQRVTEVHDSANDSINDSTKEEIECLPPAPPTKDKEEKIVEVVDNISVRVRGSAQDGGTPSAKKALMMMNDILERNGLIVESAMRQHHLTKDQLSYWMAKFYDHIVLTCHGEYPNERQLMTHFWCWYNKKQEYLKTQKDAENRRITERKQYLTADEKRQLGYLVYERDFNIKMGLPVNPDTERKINAILNGDYDSLYGEQVH